MRRSDLNEYVDSYDEHWRKAAKAVGDPSKVHDVNGWIGDLRHFAEKARDEATRIINSGGTVNSKNDPSDKWDIDRVETFFNERLTHIMRLQEENTKVARANGIPIRE